MGQCLHQAFLRNYKHMVHMFISYYLNWYYVKQEYGIPLKHATRHSAAPLAQPGSKSLGCVPQQNGGLKSDITHSQSHELSITGRAAEAIPTTPNNKTIVKLQNNSAFFVFILICLHLYCLLTRCSVWPKL